jgi:p-hydroxybenzoate 3-monooxygenase
MPRLATRRRVVIIGAGPAGLVLGNALIQAGVECLVAEKHSRAEVERRSRAGITEHRTVQTLQRLGLAAGLLSRGKAQDHCEFRSGGGGFVLPYAELTGGIGHVVYPQQDLVRDMADAFLAGGGELLFETEAESISLDGPDSAAVALHSAAGRYNVGCAAVAGCDGRYGASPRALPAGAVREHAGAYPYRWLTLLTAAPPSVPQPLYALHPEGFAGQMLRTRQRTRFYLQYGPADRPLEWTDEQVWERLSRRLAAAGRPPVVSGPVLERTVLAMDSRVCAPMQCGPLYLAGDAAHTLPPAGGKGMNLAVADAAELAEALVSRFRGGDGGRRLAGYSSARLPEVWRALAFTDWLLHLINLPGDLPVGQAEFEYQLRIVRLAALRESVPLATWFARAYVGLPAAARSVSQAGRNLGEVAISNDRQG